MADTYVTDQTFTTKQTYSVTAGEHLYLKNLTFNACQCQISGEGDLTIEGIYIYGLGGGTAMVMNMSGSVQVSDVTIIGEGIKGARMSSSHQWSALTIRALHGGGPIQNIHTIDYPGNGILCEPTPTGNTISGITFIDTRATRCGGAMWLLNVTGCTVTNPLNIDSHYRESNLHFSGTVGHQSIIDEQATGPGNRPKGDTVFSGVREYESSRYKRTGIKDTTPPVVILLEE